MTDPATVVAHVFGERTMATLGRLMSLLSPFDVVIWMTDGWPLYESRLKGKLHVISKRYTQRIERHNLNLRQHLARLGRKSLSTPKSVELHDKSHRALSEHKTLSISWSHYQKEGVIKLKPGVDKVTARISDIVENPKKLKFLPNVEAALLPQMYNNDEGDAVVINANYAIDAGLDPVKDPIAVESGENNPYANIITVHRGDEKKKDIVALVDVLHSKEIQDWIRTKYKGAVIPVNN